MGQEYYVLTSRASIHDDSPLKISTERNGAAYQEPVELSEDELRIIWWLDKVRAGQLFERYVQRGFDVMKCANIAASGRRQGDDHSITFAVGSQALSNPAKGLIDGSWEFGKHMTLREGDSWLVTGLTQSDEYLLTWPFTISVLRKFTLAGARVGLQILASS